MTPDFIFKGSFDGKIGDRAIHFDAGTVMRVFRSWNGRSTSDKDHAFGIGGNANLTVEVVKNVRLVLDGFADQGAGRYIGGLAPDVIVKADGSISPITSYSWVGGFEIAPSKKTGFYIYYSGLYSQKNSTLNSDGTCCVGFGYPGANTQCGPDDRGIHPRLLAGGLEAREPRFRAVGYTVCVCVAVSLAVGRRPELGAHQHGVRPDPL